MMDGISYARSLINYLEPIQKMQADLLLDEITECKAYLSNLIDYYKNQLDTFTSEKI